ncbi:MAG: TldD/PmbA family protein [Clostridiales bacterium]|nr:TldD/PmbA family protein [Clostridiales bacterium]
MIREETARAVLAEAQKSGADYAELFLEDNESTRIEMIDGKVESANYARICGAGVRVLLGTKSAYAYGADTSERALLEIARAAAAALGEAKAAPGGEVSLPLTRFTTPVRRPFDTIGNAERVEVMRTGARVMKQTSGEVTQALVRYLDQVQRVTIVSTDGVFVTDERPRTRIFLQAVAMNGSEAQTGYSGPGCCRGFEAYEDVIDVEQHAKIAADMAVTMLHAPECPAGNLPVVIDGGFGGVIFHEACGHSLEATAVGRNNSVFCGKLNTKIAADCVTAVDDGTLPGEWGSINVDDEGGTPQRNVLIENGILKGYLIDKLGSRRMNLPSTGSSRRQGYLFAPTSRMTNTFISPGSDDDEEMISGMAEGLYAKKMGGGSVNPPTGEFNFSVAEGYWVKNGKIVSPVRGATLIGKGSEILLKIDRVGKNMWMAPGMCGSLSGSVPTNVGQPRIRVSGMTIGGKGGAIE